MIFPAEYLGDVIELCEENRGTQLEQDFVGRERCLLRYKLPLAHLVDDFFGKLKGRTRGYASLDYEDMGYEQADIVKMEVRYPWTDGVGGVWGFVGFAVWVLIVDVG
jgi:translation factor GUF1, mitochondrial